MRHRQIPLFLIFINEFKIVTKVSSLKKLQKLCKSWSLQTKGRTQTKCEFTSSHFSGQ